MSAIPTSLPRPLRIVVRIVGAGALVLATGCGSPVPDPASGDHAYGVVAAPPLPTAVPTSRFDPGAQIADVDGSVVVSLTDGELQFARDGGAARTSVPVDGDPEFARDGGAARTSVPVDGDLELRAVSADGSRAALFAGAKGTGSRVVVVDLNAAEPVVTEFDLPGLVEPEAFSTDGSSLFVIDHQVAAAPGAYRVRPLDLATGRLETILGPTKVPFGDDMNGTGRRQVWSPDGSRLYTLYIRQTHHHHDDGSVHAHGDPGTDGFVHVLDLDEEWAFCLDLPKGFGAGDLDTTALAVAPDGKTIAVADVTAGAIAFASTVDLAVTRTAPLPAGALVEGELYLGMTRGSLLISSGDSVQWFDQDSLAPLGEPVLVGAPVMAITSDAWAALVWTDAQEHGPLQLQPPSSAS